MKDNDVRTWLYYHLPLTLAVQKDKMLRKLIGKNIGSLLDVGCGIGKYKVFAKHYSVGIDIFENSLEMSKRNGYYSELILGDVRNLDFANKSFDGVICTDVIEHISKEDGYKLLDKMESISRKTLDLFVGSAELLHMQGQTTDFYEYRQQNSQPGKFQLCSWDMEQ